MRRRGSENEGERICEMTAKLKIYTVTCVEENKSKYFKYTPKSSTVFSLQNVLVFFI
jgi:hypothetical protein